MFGMTELTPVFPSLEYTSYTYADQEVHKVNPEPILDPTLALKFWLCFSIRKATQILEKLICH